MMIRVASAPSGEFVAIVQGDTDTARTPELATGQAGAVVFLSPGFRARRFGVRSFNTWPMAKDEADVRGDGCRCPPE